MLEVTEKAAAEIKNLLEREDTPEGVLRVRIIPGGCSGYKFDMDYADGSQINEDDRVFVSNGIKVVVDKGCLEEVLGSLEIDYQSGNPVESGFKFRQLINGALCGCGESFTPIKQQRQR